MDLNREVTPCLPCAKDETLLIIKAEQRVENTQGPNQRQLAREQRALRCRQKRKLPDPRSCESGCLENSEFFTDVLQRVVKQLPLNDIIDIGAPVKITFIQGSK